MLAPRRQGLVELFQRGIERGEVDAAAPIELVAELIPAMVMMHVLFKHESPGPELVTQLVDDAGHAPFARFVGPTRGAGHDPVAVA